jgi:hypothetical protein
LWCGVHRRSTTEEECDVADTNPEDGWRLELQPSLIEIANHLRKRPPSDRPVAVPIGTESISVTPAEREVLRSAERGGAGLAQHFLLVSDGLVLRARLLDDLAELAAATEEAKPQAAAKVRHDVDMGYKLLRAMQGELAVLMSTGKVEHGRRLAEHRGFVSEAVKRATRRLVDAGFQADARPSEGGDADGDATSPSRERRVGRRGQLLRWLPTAVAGLLFALLAVLLLQLWNEQARNLPQVGAADFTFLPGVEKVVCRPPGVILVVPGDRWARLSGPARVQAVENSVLAVEHLGYRRLEIRSRTGNVLGEWRKGKGVSVRN